MGKFCRILVLIFLFLFYPLGPWDYLITYNGPMGQGHLRFDSLNEISQWVEDNPNKTIIRIIKKRTILEYEEISQGW